MNFLLKLKISCDKPKSAETVFTAAVVKIMQGSLVHLFWLELSKNAERKFLNSETLADFVGLCRLRHLKIENDVRSISNRLTRSIIRQRNLATILTTTQTN